METARQKARRGPWRGMVHPIVLGTGKRLFKEGAAGTELALTDCRKVGPDVLLLIYRPAKLVGPPGRRGCRTRSRR